MADDDKQAPDKHKHAVETDQTATARTAGAPRRRSAYATRDLTKGSIPRNLWSLAWPQIGEGFLSVVDHVADLVWAGRLGFQAIAGLGVAQTYIIMTNTARMGLEAGMRSMVARAVGARRIAYANHVVLQSLALATVLGVVMVLAGLFLSVPLLRVVGLSDAVVNQAAGYMQIQFVAMAVMGYHRLSAGALQASGDSLTPFKAAAVTRVTHLVLSPLLIFGVGWFPSMGLPGAAVARLVAEWLGVGMNFFALTRGTSRLHLTLKGFYVDLPLIWRIVRVGAPASVTGMQRSLSQLTFVIIVAPFGDMALAAFGLTRRVENLANQSSRGLGRAAGALAAQNLGAGDAGRAKSSVKWAMIYVVGASLTITALLVAFPEAVASFFSNDSDFVSQAGKWITVLAIGTLSMATVQVYTQAFNGTGDTLAPMVVTVCTVWAVDIPLAFALSNMTSLDQFGVPWAIVIGMSLRVVVFTWYYMRGGWLRTGVV